MKKLSKRDKRALIIGGGLVVVYLLVFHVVWPFYDAGAGVIDDVGRKEALLSKELRTIQTRDVDAAQLDVYERALAQYEQRLLDAPDPATAATQLDDIVRNIASANNVSLTKSNPLQEKKVGDRYTKVTIQINVDANLASTTAFLHAISVHPKFLLVEDFAVSRFRTGQQFQPRMNVSAFIRLS
jgi:Tfp pilus assembly protein PilO